MAAFCALWLLPGLTMSDSSHRRVYGWVGRVTQWGVRLDGVAWPEVV